MTRTDQRREWARAHRGLLTLVVALVALPVWAQGGGKQRAMSPVGAWDMKVFDLDGNEVFSDLSVFNGGGTMLAKVSADTTNLAFGTWRMTGARTFSRTFYLFGIDANNNLFAYLEVRQRFEMIDRDTIRGESQADLLFGTDPFDPDSVAPFVDQTLIGKRLPRDGFLPWR